MKSNRYYTNKAKAIKTISDGTCMACNCKIGLVGSVFHHIDSDTKMFNVSDKLGNIWNDSIEREVNKCIVMCPTCHNMLHSYIGSKKVTEADTMDFLSNYESIAKSDIDMLEYYNI